MGNRAHITEIHTVDHDPNRWIDWIAKLTALADTSYLKKTRPRRAACEVQIGNEAKEVF